MSVFYLYNKLAFCGLLLLYIYICIHTVYVYMYKSHAASMKICLVFREVCVLATSCSLSYQQI